MIARTIQTPKTAGTITVTNADGTVNTSSNPAQIVDAGLSTTVTATETNFGQYEQYLRSQTGDWGDNEYCYTADGTSVGTVKVGSLCR